MPILEKKKTFNQSLKFHLNNLEKEKTKPKANRRNKQTNKKPRKVTMHIAKCILLNERS